MLESASGHVAVQEKLIADAIRGVAIELRAVDAVDLVSYIHASKFANVGDLIDSSIELHFKPGTVRFSYSGDVRLDWFGKPVVGLDMEFHAGGVAVFFRMMLDALTVGVDLRHISRGGGACSIAQLEDAIASARLTTNNRYRPAPDKIAAR